jgi:hypothetical protein
VSVRGHTVYLSGEVTSLHRKNELEIVVREHLQLATLRNDVHVVAHSEPTEREDLT